MIRRSLASAISVARRQFPVLLVTGARQVGKSTLLESLREPARTLVTLDDPRLLELAKADPALFLQRYQPPLLIDEVQYAAELLPHIKMVVDQRKQPDLYWLTGSQPFHLMKGVSESLAGRVAVLELFGLSQRELLDRPADGVFDPRPAAIESRMEGLPPLQLSALYHRIWTGSYPALASSDDATRDLYLASYVQTYLQRDLRDLARVGDESAFLRFLRQCAARTGQLVTYADLARDSDIAPATARAWLSILTTSGLVHLLQPWHSNLTKRLVKAPKLYFLDTGLAAWLCGWQSAQTLESGAMAGAILETWVAGELLKSFRHAGKEPNLYFWRDRDGVEIDFLLAQDGVLFPLEVKKSANPNLNSCANFRALAKSGQQIGTGGVLSFSPHHQPLADGVWTIPLTAL